MRIVFYGTPDFAVASLKALVENGHNVVGVVTAPDKPAGRGHKLLASPVKVFAQEKGLPVLQPSNLKSEDFLTSLKELRPDIQVVVAFRMLPESVWNLPELGTYNVHASLLPNYRGAAPINWAIINGETETGVTTFKLKHEIDTGSILAQQKVEIGPEETAGELYSRLMESGAFLLLHSMNLIKSGEYELRQQELSDEHKQAPKIFKEDCEIDWTSSASDVHNFVRGLNPFPGAFTVMESSVNRERLKIHKVSIIQGLAEGAPGTINIEQNRIIISCGEGSVDVTELQLAGKRKQSAEEFLNGNRDILENSRLILK